MNRIDKKFRELARMRRKAFIAYITAGDQNLNETGKIVKLLEKSGADIIELGIPFSDPIADGPTIQAASYRSLLKGASVRKIFAMTKRLRMKTVIPIVFMTYYNPVLKYGIERFFSSCREAGVDGVIVPDLPCDEARDLIRLGKAYKVATIFLAAPTSTNISIKSIVKNSSGFIYYVSLTGVTGARARIPPEVSAKVSAIKRVTKKPVAVGFGVSTPKQARSIARVADGVIVGSAIVKLIGEHKGASSRLRKFAGMLARAIHND